jgi:hypothetical protein
VQGRGHGKAGPVESALVALMPTRPEWPAPAAGVSYINLFGEEEGRGAKHGKADEDWAVTPKVDTEPGAS